MIFKKAIGKNNPILNSTLEKGPVGKTQGLFFPDKVEENVIFDLMEKNGRKYGKINL